MSSSSSSSSVSSSSPPPHLPFSVPYPIMRRDSTASGSISEASSNSDSDRTKVAYKDDEGQDDVQAHDDAGHTYPPTPSTVKANGSRTKYSNMKMNDRAGQRAHDVEQQEEEEEDAEALLDEEERVGLMMQERGSPRWQKTDSATKKSLLFQRLKPYGIAAGTALAILLFVPLLSWLSSSTQTRRRESVLKNEKHLAEVVMPSYWHLPDTQSTANGIRKHKRPLPAGSIKMTKFGPPFSLETVIDPVPSVVKPDEKKPITIDDALGSTFVASTKGVEWSAEDPDEGVFSFRDPETGDIILQDVTHLRKEKTGSGEVAKGGGKVTYLKAEDVKDADGHPIAFDSFKISPDMRFVLLFSDRVKQWRHSSHSKVWLHDVSGRTTQQLGRNMSEPTIATAGWSKRSYITFVEGNDLYLIKNVHDAKSVIAITNDGNKDVFNAVPDWVYEEEVFSSETAHWWSPDGNQIAFLRFDETKVMTYSFPIYNPTSINGKASLYPSTIDMKYPKPGTPNPVISVFVYDVTSATKAELHDPPSKTSGRAPPTIQTSTVDAAMRSAGDSVMVTQVSWLNDHTVLMRETNRWSDAMRYVAFDTNRVTKAAGSQEGSIVGEVARRETTTKSGGWIPVSQDNHAINTGAKSTAYVDVIAVPGGFRHIAYFKEAIQQEPAFLTAGAWEVDKILFVHNGRVYFSAAYPRPASRHILYVDLPQGDNSIRATDKPKSLTDVEQTAWYEADFDPKGNYYQLTYKGPSVPWVKVLSLRDPTFKLVIEDNAQLANNVAQFQQPQRLFYNITIPDGTVISAEEWRPHDFDSSGAIRYPVLVKVYGGPNSQTVQATWGMNDWTSYLTSTLGYIVVKIDGRGTGFRGRDYRDIVTWHLGTYESHDVVEAAEAIRRLPYVAQSTVGIWGWSFGGYLTAKTLERDSGTFDLGMSVAPVSRWEFYDTIYTERYMKTPHLNKAGYENASVHVNQGFENSQFLLAQGSADDNVHFQSSAHLLDQLTGKKIRSFWFRMFPDSSHSITNRGAYRELHEFMTRFLVYNWGAGGQRLFRYETDKSGLRRRMSSLWRRWQGQGNV